MKTEFCDSCCSWLHSSVFFASVFPSPPHLPLHLSPCHIVHTKLWHTVTLCRLKLTVLSEDRLQMKWKEADGPVQGYKVRVRPISEVPQPELMLTTTRGRATVAGLDSSQEYALQVLVLNGTTERLLAKRRFTIQDYLLHASFYQGMSPRKPFECDSDAAADIMLLVDGSWSIGRTNFRRVRDFLEGLMTPFHIGPDHIQIGLTQYSGDPRTEWQLNNFTTKDQLLEAVRNFRYKGGNTFTGQALLHVMEENMRAKAGARSDTPFFLVLLTDGKSQDDAIAAANRLKNAGVEIIAVGVKNADEAELRQVASEPVDLNVYNVNDFPLLSKLVGLISDPALSYPSPTDLRFSELGSREVKLHWTNPSKPVQQYRVVYHSAEGQSPQEVVLAGSESTVLLEGLSSQTLYHVSIFPVARPRSIFFKTMFVPSIRCCSHSASHSNEISFQVEVTGLISVVVQNLSSLSRYLVSVQSLYPQGLSAALTSNVTTLKVPSPSDLRVTNFSGSDITVRWEAAADDVVSYLIKWISLSGGDLRQLRVSGESEGAILEGVEDDKEYQISLSALYRDGAQSEAVATRYSTSSISVSEETAVSLVVSWVPPNAHVLQYRVSYTALTLLCPSSCWTVNHRASQGSQRIPQTNAHSSVEGVAAEPFVFNTLPTFTLYRDVQLTQRMEQVPFTFIYLCPSRFIHPAGFSPEHTISITFRVLQETPREPFALWQLTDNDFQPKMGVVLDPNTKHLVYFSLDYRGEVQELTFDQSQVYRLFYGSFHKVHLSVSQVSVSLSVDCQRVGERPARPLGNLPTDGFEMLGKLVKTRGPNSGSAPVLFILFHLFDFYPGLLDEESCPAPAYTCTCSSDIPGAPGSPGPTVCHHEISVRPRILTDADSLFV
uniref:Uncharacterized protein n=1 Tax=Sander lucioperca TaxID=283035 RepID=A0A8C9XIA2_SANLU